MKNLTLYVILTILITNCATFGTKTLYKKEANGLNKPISLGFSQLKNDSIIDEIISGTSDIYNSVMESELIKRSVKPQIVKYQNFDKWTDLDEKKISEICSLKKLDGIIFTQLKFINTEYRMMLIPIGKSEDTYVEMKYFDKSGELLLHTKHDTERGNSYLTFPKSKKTVPDGLKGALKRIFKEIEK